MIGTALALLLALAGQDAPPPAYALITARFRTYREWGTCPEDMVCNIDFRMRGYVTNVTTFDGPRVPEGALVGEPPPEYDVPVVAIMEVRGSAQRIVTYATAQGVDGMACIARDKVPGGWWPKGPGVVDRGSRICATVADIPKMVPIKVRVIRP